MQLKWRKQFRWKIKRKTLESSGETQPLISPTGWGRKFIAIKWTYVPLPVNVIIFDKPYAGIFCISMLKSKVQPYNNNKKQWLRGAARGGRCVCAWPWIPPSSLPQSLQSLVTSCTYCKHGLLKAPKKFSTPCRKDQFTPSNFSVWLRH